MKKSVLYIVVPCYNEEEVLMETANRLKAKMVEYIDKEFVSAESKILFVNDGSKDKTWDIITTLHQENNIYSGVSLSRNRGHQNALIAGLTVAVKYADAIVSIDADLQDDVNAIDGMISKFNSGIDIVYGVRSSRTSDTFFKRFSAEAYYKILKIMGVDIVFNHADFRLMSRRAVESLLKFKETNLFLRGIVPQLGYKCATVEYERAERYAGESKYPLKKMLSLAFDGISSFSVKPIRFITGLGCLICTISILMFFWGIIQYFAGYTVPGWSSLMVSIWFLGGVQLLCVGVIGEYVGKIYNETKHRPRFIIDKILSSENKKMEED